MDCPRCGTGMMLRHEGLHGDIPVNSCSTCLALWMRPESLDRLDDNINVDASKLDWRPSSTSEYQCTVCPSGYRGTAHRLLALTLSHEPSATLVIHRCEQCDGLLLDQDTLEGIQAAVIRI